jgi:hypothetical protein
VEELEGRQMLSAALPPTASAPTPSFNFVAKPTFVIATHPNSGVQPNNNGPITPQQMQAAYGVNQISFNGIVGTGAGQTVAIVDAYNDPSIVADTAKFNTFYNLQQFNTVGGPTLSVLGQDGTGTLPTGNDVDGWDVEESLDVQWVHSIAPQANIILFEANSSDGNDLYATELSAAANPAVTVVSNSWGGGEYSSENQDEASFFLTPVKHQGVTFLASTGDDGTPAGFPSFSRDVVAVGGTNLQVQNSGTYISESAWSDTGGGISQVESLPPFQSNINGSNGASTSFRNVPDVAADADPNSGVLVFDSFQSSNFFEVGGTSLACPLWAGMIAIADQGRALAGESSLNGETQTLPMLYSLPSTDFNDITTGGNGTYGAGPGYDLVTGLGTPKANLLVPALAGYVPGVPPTISAPSAAGVTENSPLTFSLTNANAISIADTSSGSNLDSLTLSVGHGTLTLGSITGIAFTSGSNNSASFTVSGTVSNLDAALSGLTYQPTTGYLGPDSLSVSFTDPGISQSTSGSVSLSVVPPVTGTWTPMTNFLPSGDAGQLAMLLPNGQLLVHGLGDGQGDSPAWYLVTPDSTGGYVNGTWTTANPMHVGRLYFGSAVLPNGNVFVVGGEYSSTGQDNNTAEMYNPSTNTWTQLANSPKQFVGDEPTEVLPNGSILVGDIIDNGTEIYTPSTNTWSAGGSKVHTSDVSDEEAWVKLANGDILTYDIFSSINDNKFEAELYNTVTNKWSDASTSSNGAFLPLLSTPEEGYELGPAMLLPDGRALFTGANGVTVFFNPSNSTWTLGPTMPSVMINGTLTQLTMGDAPGAILPDGDLALALSPAVNIDSLGNENFPGPTYIYDFNPTTGVYTDISPNSTVDPNLSGNNSFINTMLILPTGQLLLVDDNDQLAVYTPGTGPQTAWQPTITSFNNNGNGTYTLTGTQINGLDEGAAYGDDNQMAENYPIVRVTDTTSGKVYYATTSNWSSVGVATGTTPETATVVLPAALGNDPYTLVVIADGIASNAISSAPLAPTFVAPTTVSVNENSSVTFSGGNAITVADTSGTAEQLTLSVSHGTLDFGSTTGLAISNNGTATVVVTGTLFNLNNDLPSLTYTPTVGYTGPDTLTLSDQDLTDSLTGNASVPITVKALVAPTIAAPTSVIADENGTLAFAGGNAITVADSSGTAEQLTLIVGKGTLSLGTTTGLTVNGNGTATVTLTGLISDLNTDLTSLIYTPTANYIGPDTLSLSDVDTADSLTGTNSVSITVRALAPSLIAPTTVTVIENSSVAFTSGNLIAVSDVSGTAEQLTLTVSHGTLSLGTTTGLTVSGNGSGDVVLTGSLDNLNTDLASLSYTPTAGYFGTDTLSLSDTDTTDSLSGAISVALTIQALAPAVSAPATENVDANSSLAFSTGNGNAISISDPNPGGDSLSLSVGHGTLTLPTVSGLTFTSGSNGGASFTVTGTLSNLAAALNGLSYQPTLNYLGADSLSISITNLGDNKSASTSVSLDVLAFPTVTGPSTANVTENVTFTFTSGNGNEISVSDLSAGGNADQLTLSAGDGTLTLGSTTGITFTSGTNGSAAFTISGTVGSLNAAINGLNYQPIFGYVGPDTLAVSLADPTDHLSGSSSVAISVNAVSPPLISNPSTASLSENGSLVFSSGNSNAITVADNGAGTNSDSMTLSVSNGILTLGSTTGLIFTSGNNGTASFTVKGNLTNLNTALNGLKYQPTTNFAGSDALGVLVVDSGDGKSGSSSVALTIIALPPAITAPATGTVSQNGSLSFSTANGNAISLNDQGAVGSSDSLTLSVSHGTLTLATTTGISFTSGSNGSASFTVTGTLTNLNAALNGLVYQPTALYSGPDSLSVSILNSVDSESASKSVALAVNALNPPTVTAPATATVIMNGTLVFSAANGDAISVTDVAAGSTPDSLTLTVSHGTLTLASTTGLTFTAGANNSASLTVTGSIANLNAALSGLTYKPGSGYVGADSLLVSITDPGDNDTASKGIAITVNSANPPTITGPGAASVSLNGTLVFSSSNGDAITVADTGPGSSSDTLTLSVSHGTLTLATTTGLTFTTGANGSASFMVTGSVASLNAALSGMTYKPTTGYTGSDSLAATIRDSDDNLSASTSVSLTVTSGGTPPSITANPTFKIAINTTLVFSTANGDAITINDSSAGSSVEQLTMTTSHGTLKLGSTTGITIINGANNSVSMTIGGTLAALNAAINGLTFTPTKFFTGVATITMGYTDLGNGLMGSAAINVTVVAQQLGQSAVSTSSGPQAAVSTAAPVSTPAVSGGATPAATTTAVAGAPTETESTPPADSQIELEGFKSALQLLLG